MLSPMERHQLDQDTKDNWCRYLPDLHRLLADPNAATDWPVNYCKHHLRSLRHQECCSWWETLRYIFKGLLGWKNLPAGLAWWYANDKATFDQPLLQLVRERWDSTGELDYFAAREWYADGHTGNGLDELPWSGPLESPYEPSPGWWRSFYARGPLFDYSPFGTGWNELHLGYSDFIGEAPSPSKDEPTRFYDLSTRTATLIVSDFDCWKRELREFGELLPQISRSWHMEVFDRKIAYLGLFRQSRVTKRWFQGKHSIHMAGNPTKSGVVKPS